MFTGIIRHLGTIQTISPTQDSASIFTLSTPLSSSLTEGDSIAVNGACLTVLSHTDTSLELRLMQETLAKTNLGQLTEGDSVNLERPLSVGERLDGHFVQGHVDAVCEITNLTEAGDDRIFTFKPPQDLLPYLIPKGSVALDGVSLTVVDVTDDAFTVSIMPYTLEHTTFGSRAVHSMVNIEVDMIGKYVRRFTTTA